MILAKISDNTLGKYLEQFWKRVQKLALAMSWLALAISWLALAMGQALGPWAGPGPALGLGWARPEAQNMAVPAQPWQILGPGPGRARPRAQGPAQGPRLGQTWPGMPAHSQDSEKEAWGSEKIPSMGSPRKKSPLVRMGSPGLLSPTFYGVTPGPENGVLAGGI